ncbi:glycosyltransferase family 4 protein [Desulfovibrio sulfodismutans]|uniref:Glycosyltransferase family 4 protein n=1 Tax=Desulfolutivibrio sulfodismutans TaxID=63561 RepID=A0A7K3NGX4_9BACT|nr:glycosyltransferase family 1 protein [Desulfolutivibrio sulfodismutans]NDY55454.1 glycosyltransferase family 4 protein [Desulfolutivibrio sulfodismutans]QLA12844.1 glycosyltransferase [Desulfolutivibrio sulfodismutans DSM 3696]
MTRPRIAVDLHSLTGLMQGVRTYSLQLAQRLPGLDPDSDYLFYLPDVRGDEAARLAVKNVSLRRIPGSRLARLLSFGTRLARDRADLLHGQYLSPPFLPCPAVLTLHDVLHESHPRFYPARMRLLMRRLYPLAARRAALVLTCSQYCRREIIERYGVPEHRVAAIPLAAGGEFRPARNETDRAEASAVAAKYGLRGRYVLFVGRLEPRKNIPALVRAFQALGPHGGGELTLAAAGMADPLFATRDARELVRGDRRVSLLGRVAPEDLPHLYRGAELFAFPSHAEGFGLPPLEAMASGVPVVCSDTTALPEVVGDAGLLVSPNDEAGLARAMQRILTDGELRASLIARGLAQSGRFSWDATARATCAAYHRVLGDV